MKKVYEDFVEALENADYVIKTFFETLIPEIKRWFTEGSLGAQKCVLEDDDIEINMYNPMLKYLIVKFISTEDNFHYDLIYIVSIDKLSKENQIEKLHLKIKRYVDDDKIKLDAELLEEIDIEDANKEDFIISKIDELKKPEDKEQADLTDNVYKM